MKRYLTAALFAAGCVVGWWAARRDVADVASQLEGLGRLPVPELFDQDDDEVGADPGPVDDEAVADSPRAGWTVPFDCDHCGTRNNPAAGPDAKHVDLIRWAGERDPRFRWVLRLWCDNCPDPSVRPISERSSELWRYAFGLEPYDMYAPTVSDNVAAALLEGDGT